jgi:hypothetical protein
MLTSKLKFDCNFVSPNLLEQHERHNQILEET